MRPLRLILFRLSAPSSLLAMSEMIAYAVGRGSVPYLLLTVARTRAAAPFHHASTGGRCDRLHRRSCNAHTTSGASSRLRQPRPACPPCQHLLLAGLRPDPPTCRPHLSLFCRVPRPVRMSPCRPQLMVRHPLPCLNGYIFFDVLWSLVGFATLDAEDNDGDPNQTLSEFWVVTSRSIHCATK